MRTQNRKGSRSERRSSDSRKERRSDCRKERRRIDCRKARSDCIKERRSDCRKERRSSGSRKKRCHSEEKSSCSSPGLALIYFYPRVVHAPTLALHIPCDDMPKSFSHTKMYTPSVILGPLYYTLLYVLYSIQKS